MDNSVIGIVAFVVMILVIFLGVPIGAAIGIVALFAYWALDGLQNTLTVFGSVTAETLVNREMATIPLFLMMGVPAGARAVTIAHIMFCISFVVVAVKARVATLDPRLEEAAADLGANPFQTFLRVTFPLAFPGILAGALLAFSLSFDDYIITNFNASPSSITFPMYVWGAAQRGAPVQVNVIGTMMFLIALVVVVIGQVFAVRRERSRIG